MKKNIMSLLVLSLLVISISCNETNSENTLGRAQASLSQPSQQKSSTEETPQQIQYSKGMQIPHELVCMVNNEFMGKKQIPIPFEGKIYYGCCEGCVQGIKADETTRTAIDPETGEKVDKAKALIVLLGEDGSVAYFASEKNYKTFLARNMTN